MKIKGSSYFLIFILLLAAYVTGQSLTFDNPEDKTMLVIAGGVVIVLAVVQLTRELRGKEGAHEPTEENGERVLGPGEERRRIGSVLGWIAGFIGGTFLLGFAVATPVFVLSFLKLHGASWLKAVAIALTTTAVIYGLFDVGLKVDLYQGVLASLW